MGSLEEKSKKLKSLDALPPTRLKTALQFHNHEGSTNKKNGVDTIRRPAGAGGIRRYTY